MFPPLKMKPDSRSPAAHLVRFGVATSRSGFRAFLRHAWMQTSVIQNGTHAESASDIFDAAISMPDVQFPLGKQPWTGVLARALRRVARLFADESLAVRFSASSSGATIAPVLNAFAPMCAEMDMQLEISGFEIQLGESEAAVREQLCPHLPEYPVVPHLGAARVWLPEFFSGMMHASLWREILADPESLRLAATSAAEVFAQVFKDLGTSEEPPSAAVMEQAMLVFTPQAVDYGLGQITWMMEPGSAKELEAHAIPFLRASFSRDVPLPPVVAPVSRLPKSAKALPQSSVPAKDSLPPKALATMANQPEPIPTLRPISKAPEIKPEQSHTFPLIPDDDDEDEEIVPQRAFRVVQWLPAGIGIVLVILAILPFVTTGGLDIGGSNTPKLPPEPGPERMVVGPVEALPEPVAVASAPISTARLFEQAQIFIDAAARAKTAGDNRQAAEDLARVLLIYKQEFGEQRWKEPRYTAARDRYHAQLELLEMSKDQIAVIDEVIGAREPAKAGPTDAPGPEITKMASTFERGDEELARGRPKAAAENYELALRIGMEALGDKITADRAYQRYLSRYIDFLITENLAPDELQSRLSDVKAGRKPKPLPNRKIEAELDGLGLPKL